MPSSSYQMFFFFFFLFGVWIKSYVLMANIWQQNLQRVLTDMYWKKEEEATTARTVTYKPIALTGLCAMDCSYYGIDTVGYSKFSRVGQGRLMDLVMSVYI